MAQFMCRFSFLFLLAAVIARASHMHTIKVGYGGNFVFDPEETNADVGDVVIFEFFPTNHSVVRGEYAESEACGAGGCNPCIPYELFHNGQQGFYSGNVLTQTVSTNGNVPTFNITIGDSSAIWFYCSALDSCHPNGMVGVINPASGQSLDTQKRVATNANYQLSPGQTSPAEGSQPVSAAPSPSTKLNSTRSQRLSGGAIAGIVIGVLLIIAIAVGFVFFMKRFKRQKITETSELDSKPIRKLTDVEGQEVPISYYEQQPLSVVQDGTVSPLSPQQPQRSKSVFQRARQQVLNRVFYQYPPSDKPEVPLEEHPAFRNSEQRYGELDGDQTFNRI